MTALWIVITILLSLAGVLCLLALTWLILDKLVFRGKDGTPDSAAHFVVMKAVSLWRRFSQKLEVDGGKLSGLKPPFVVLCNHDSFYDFYYTEELLKNYKPAYIINHHVTSAPVLRHISKKAGMIPKKMFYPDTAAVKMLRTIRAGYPVVVFPEGRLSIDGRSGAIVESAAALYKKLGVPLVLARIAGGYLTYPKWRGKFYRGKVRISVERVLAGEELKQMSVGEIEKVIEDALRYNAFEEGLNRFPQKDKARGLENVLYRCADCGELYTTESRGCELYCTACGKVHHLDESYHFTDEIGSIPAYYDRIREMERAELDGLDLRAEVEVKVFPDKNGRVRKERGVCALSREAFSYRSDKSGFTVPTERIPALAFACNKLFEIYYNNDQYYFYPTEHRRQAVRWSLIVDLLREERAARLKSDTEE